MILLQKIKTGFLKKPEANENKALCCSIDKSKWNVDPKFVVDEDLSMLINPYVDVAKCFVQSFSDLEILHCTKEGKTPGTRDDGREVALLRNKNNGLFAYYNYLRGDWHSHEYHYSTYHFVSSQEPSLHSLCACAFTQSMKGSKQFTILRLLKNLGISCRETDQKVLEYLCASQISHFREDMIFPFEHGYSRYLPCFYEGTTHKRGVYVDVSTQFWKRSVSEFFNLEDCVVRLENQNKKQTMIV